MDTKQFTKAGEYTVGKRGSTGCVTGLPAWLCRDRGINPGDKYIVKHRPTGYGRRFVLLEFPQAKKPAKAPFKPRREKKA